MIGHDNLEDFRDAEPYLSPPEDPALQGWGGLALELAVCYTACLPQGLRESTPVERGRQPRPH